jgi:hypothetical protein
MLQAGYGRLFGEFIPFDTISQANFAVLKGFLNFAAAN